jgi:hypothetical protein
VNRKHAHIGFWSAVTYAALLIALNVSFAIMAIRVPASAWQGMEVYANSYQIIAFVPQSIGLLALPALLLVFVTLHFYTADGRKIWSLAGLLFATTHVTLLGALYFIQVAVLLPALTAGTWQGLDQFAFANPRSVAWGLNHYAWAMLGVALVLTAWAFGHNPLERWLRRLFLLNGVANILLMVAFAFSIEMLTIAIALVSWVMALPVAVLLVALLLRRLYLQEGDDRLPGTLAQD